jgi:photosystem II stability/assembly factor-like uncharacterized protein
MNIHAGSFTSIIVDPLDSNTIYVVSNYGPGGVFKSTNAGVDWTQMVQNDVGQYVAQLWFNALSIDPTNNKRLIAVNHAGCTGPWAPNCIAETRDAGATWKLIKAPIDWSEGNGVYIIDDQTMLFTSYQGGMFLTKDDGANWMKVGQGLSGGGMGLSPFKASDGAYYFGSPYGVVSSTDFVTWTQVKEGTFGQMAGTAKHLIASSFFEDAFLVAEQSAPTVWAKAEVKMNSLPVGAPYMAYDKEHKILYTSNYTNLRRVVIE